MHQLLYKTQEFMNEHQVSEKSKAFKCKNVCEKQRIIKGEHLVYKNLTSNSTI